VLHSGAQDRATYLRRPDLGRQLAVESRGRLKSGSYDVSVAMVDGLSAPAVEHHAVPLLEQLLPLLEDWSFAPLCIVEQGRVAIGDDIAFALGARMSLVLIGERPGLSSPDSLGAYLTWSPRLGRTDAERNCISNIRLEGLGYEEAAVRLSALMREARRLELTGVMLKERLAIATNPAT